MALQDIGFKLIFGKPVLFYLGLMTFTSLVTTAILGFLVLKGKMKFIYHKIFAVITLLLALTHGLLGVLAYI